jgi:hypothetical protein
MTLGRAVAPLHFMHMTFNPNLPELHRRLCELHKQQPADDPASPAMRIGIEDEAGELIEVVETTRLVQAVRVFELLGEFGFQRRRAAHRHTDQAPGLTCVYVRVH